MVNSNEEARGTNSSFLTPTCLTLSDGIIEVIPSCDDDMKPKIGQTFNSLDEAVEFYKRYASISGFSTRLSTTSRPRGGGNEFNSRRMVCNKEGKREKSDGKKSDRVALETRVGCRAMIYFKRQVKGLYKVTAFQEVHNHILVSPSSMLFMKENRNMTSVQKTFVVKAARLKLGPVRAYRGWKELSGGYGNVGASEADFKNFIRDLKLYIGDFDGQMFIENFIRRKETCPSFFFDFEVDENNRLSRVFWADPICRKNNVFFGEMVSIDATYGTNKYDMKFVPITGVDNHKRCVVLGAGLITNEDVESFQWLFKAYLVSSGDRPPRVIISDQDPAMKIAIAEVFPKAVHRLCMWHIMKKLREKVIHFLFFATSNIVVILI